MSALRNASEYMVRGADVYRLVTDHLGSVRLVVKVSDGSVVQRIDYDEFGVVSSDTAPGLQPFGFAGGLYDADTKLVRFGARDYDAETGRWTSRDPVLWSGGQANLYRYCHADPINWVDPRGLQTIGPPPGGGAGGASGGYGAGGQEGAGGEAGAPNSFPYRPPHDTCNQCWDKVNTTFAQCLQKCDPQSYGGARCPSSPANRYDDCTWWCRNNAEQQASFCNYAICLWETKE
jgi:RHS repeat-associated protein